MGYKIEQSAEGVDMHADDAFAKEAAAMTERSKSKRSPAMQQAISDPFPASYSDKVRQVGEINTKNKCFWIFLQSIFIDSVSDFSVGFNDITSATCDEALTGPVFVPCPGATRRRMGIISDIPRPDYQQCKVVEYDWSVVFNHP